MMRKVFIAAVLLSPVWLHGEALHYSINWASGLSLGEATLDSNRSSGAGPWKFGLDLDASVPGFAIKEKYSSSASEQFCSTHLEKHSSRGTKVTDETVTFDQENQTITRQTKGGGKSDVNVNACARDPLTFLQFVRKELADGRLAPQQSVVLGSTYQVRFEYAGVQHVQIGKEHIEAERIHTTVKGPASDITFDIFFARDSIRTPVMARIPLPLGEFVVELMR